MSVTLLWNVLWPFKVAAGAIAKYSIYTDERKRRTRISKYSLSFRFYFKEKVWLVWKYAHMLPWWGDYMLYEKIDIAFISV